MSDEMDQVYESLARSEKALAGAQERLTMGLERLLLEPEPTAHTVERIKHYYLVVKDCKANVERSSLKFQELMDASFNGAPAFISTTEYEQGRKNDEA